MMAFDGGPFAGTPAFYIYDPSGKIVARNVGTPPQQGVEKFIERHDANQWLAVRYRCKACAAWLSWFI